MNKRGFTLVELIALLGLLAILALMITPNLINQIQSQKENNYENFIGNICLASESYINHTSNVPGKENFNNPGDTLEISVGDLIQNGYIKRGMQNPKTKTRISPSNVIKVTITENNTYSCSLDQRNFRGTLLLESSGSNKTYKGIVYMDPSDLSKTCNSSSTITTTPTGCKKFYIYDDSGSTYKMLMDRNTTAKIAYNTTRPYVAYEDASIKSQVEEDTSGWVGSPRLITADEVAAITETSGFDSMHTLEINIGQEYAWLLNYTRFCANDGCDTPDASTDGYWTSSACIEPDNAWSMNDDARLYHKARVSYNDSFGIRPVIEVDKSSLQ